MMTKQFAGRVGALLILCLSIFAADQSRKEFKYIVGPKASVTINNEYGPVSVKPSGSNQVVVTATTHSDKVEVDDTKIGNRIEFRSHRLDGSNPANSSVDYEVLVPADARVIVHSTDGPLRAQQLRGDVTLEGDTALVDVRDVSDAHVHVNTLNGPVTLTDIHNGHVEINSVGGDVVLNAVSGPLVSVTSTTGRISYNGDFGSGGEYKLSSHSGDIEATIPAAASFDVRAHSVRGSLENDFPLQPKTHNSFLPDKGHFFVGTAGKAASSVLLRTISGKIHLKKR